MKVKKIPPIDLKGARKLDEPIQIVEGVLTCPVCADDLSLDGGVYLSKIGFLIPMHCKSCHSKVALEVESCNEEHAHVHWVKLTEPAPKCSTPKELN